MNVVAAVILFNTATRRYHPMLFRDSPLPGPPYDGKPRRLRSIGHHTEGFDNREAAELFILNDPACDGAVFEVDHLIEWDGEGVPASVCFLVDGRVTQDPPPAYYELVNREMAAFEDLLEKLQRGER